VLFSLIGFPVIELHASWRKAGRAEFAGVVIILIRVVVPLQLSVARASLMRVINLRVVKWIA
jgi:hypothetical protein